MTPAPANGSDSGPFSGALGVAAAGAGWTAQLHVNLRSIVGDARSEVESLRHAAMEFAQDNKHLATRTQRQIAQLQQTAASIEQITGAVRQRAVAAAQAAREIKILIGDSADKVRVGNGLTEEAQRTMAGALTTSNEMTQVIDGISPCLQGAAHPLC